MTTQDVKNLMTQTQIETYQVAAKANGLAELDEMCEEVARAVNYQAGDDDDAVAIIEDMFSQFGLEF
jgi:hypothetical protein